MNKKLKSFLKLTGRSLIVGSPYAVYKWQLERNPRYKPHFKHKHLNETFPFNFLKKKKRRSN